MMWADKADFVLYNGERDTKGKKVRYLMINISPDLYDAYENQN